MDGEIKNGVPPETRRAWHEANVRPLWESPTAHKLDDAGPQAHLWRWETMRALMLGATKVQNPAAVERRVLSLVNPENRAIEDESTVRTISAALQILLPGEAARPHRHSMNALRFVLEGNGAYTIVDGKRCLMEEGDLVLTPGWCWHEHEHRGSAPIIWLDVLDVPFHNVIGTSAFEPGPVHDLAPIIDDQAFARAGLLPDSAPAGSYSPLFRYPKGSAIEALDRMPYAPDGSRRLRYVNPMTGGSVMALLDCVLMEITAERPTRSVRTNASSVIAVVDGEGESQIGGQMIRWGPKDVFTVPQNQWASHRANRGSATLFVTSDREIYRRLGLLFEELSNEATNFPRSS